MPMTVLYLTPGSFDKGGISRYTRYQIRALREILGHANVTVYSMLGRGPEDIEEPFDVNWVAGATPERLTMANKATFVAHLAAHTLMRHPHLVVSAHVNFSGAASAFAKVVGAATLLNVYGAEVWSGFRADSAWGLRTTNLVIADCHFTARYLEDRGLRPRGSTHVIWDCVDEKKFSPGQPDRAVLQRYGIADPATHTNVLTLGRMPLGGEYKGYVRLLEAFARVAPRVPQLRLVYAGRGALVNVLRSKADQLGLADRVVFTGMVHEADLADVYRSAHVFSLISERGPQVGEGIPLTPLEAAACGVPALVGNHDGSQEAVVEGHTGFVLDPFDLSAHADRLERLARDPALRAQMSAAGLRRIATEFGYRRFVEKHQRLLANWFGAARRGKPVA